MTNTRQLILEKTAVLYAEKGYDGVAIRDISKTVGIKSASLYHHFSDKEHLVKESLAHALLKKILPLEEILQKSNLPEEKLYNLVSWLVHLACEDWVFNRIITRELLDADLGRLKFLSDTVFNKIFSRFENIFTHFNIKTNTTLSAIYIISLIWGHIQLRPVLPFLPGISPEYLTPESITRQVMLNLDLIIRR